MATTGSGPEPNASVTMAGRTSAPACSRLHRSASNASVRRLFHDVTAHVSTATPHRLANISWASWAMRHIGPEKHTLARTDPFTFGAGLNR